MIETASIVCGEPVKGPSLLKVANPYSGALEGTVVQADANDVDRAIIAALSSSTLSRYERYEILNKTREGLLKRKGEFAERITRESGLCIRESNYEIGRAADVLQFAAIESLKDDGDIYSCDISPHGKARKIFTIREPLAAVVAITPFNHPLNQVAHKVAPAIAAGASIILKPSEKTPLTAIAFVELLLESGLPPSMVSVLLGPTKEVVEKLVTDPRTPLVSFTGSVAVGKRIANTAGYKKLVLELGGNDPLIILDDADLDLGATLAAEGCFRNSGQRCTAVKRVLIHEAVYQPFLDRFLKKASEYKSGDPMDADTRVGTVIDEQSAINLEQTVKDAVRDGARILQGGGRNGALLEPTVIDEVPRTARMVCEEAFGPLAPLLRIRDLDDAIELANSTPYGLSSGVVTTNLTSAISAVKRLKAGTVNINEVPGYRIESSPFGGIKDSGLGIKEGVVEAMKCMSTVKTFSLPW